MTGGWYFTIWAAYLFGCCGAFIAAKHRNIWGTEAAFAVIFWPVVLCVALGSLAVMLVSTEEVTD
jgi:hypothetical protein